MPTYRARPMTKSMIKRVVNFIRKALNLKSGEPFPVIHFLDNYASGLQEGQYTYEIVEDRELRNSYAETDIRRKIIRIRESVYEAAIRNEEWALKVIKHEIGHYFLHNNIEPIFPKADTTVKLRDIEDPEWQADVFADLI